MLWVPKGPTGVLAWVARPICMIKEAEQATRAVGNTVKNAVELFFAFHPDVEKIQYH